MLIGLDAMGYRAANVSGSLTAETRTRLRDNLMAMALVDEENSLTDNHVLLTIREGGGETQSAPDFRIIMTPSAGTRLESHTLRLASIEAGQVGVVHLGGLDHKPLIEAQTIFDLPATTPPDPTITGTVDFILNEARHYRHKNEFEG